MKIKIIAGKKTPIEGKAIDQLKFASKLKGMKLAYGMPDLHPGKGYPIGASFLSEDIIYPYLIGGDIGCGMSFYQLSVKVRKLKQDKILKKIKSIDGPFEEDLNDWFKKYDLNKKFEYAVGTIGGSNHFAEFQKIKTVVDEKYFNQLNLEKDKLFLLVHSGSRGLGAQILENHIKKFNADGLELNDKAFSEYMKSHDEALIWASLNRELITYRLCNQLRLDYTLVNDIFHNYIEKTSEGFLHRKGAIPSNQGAVVIPGSRGSYSYLVKPKVKNLTESLFSLSHGAGRKWKRSETKGRLSHKYRKEDLLKTDLGSRVICEDKQMLYEEAPMAFKNIESVIGDLVNFDLIEIIAVLEPYVTYKRKASTPCGC